MPRKRREMRSLCLFSYVALLAAAVSGEFHLQTQDTKQVAEVGSDIFLPCTLSTPQGLAEFKVHWFRSLYLSTVILLHNGKEDKENQSPEYSGRAALRAPPGSGDLTLKLQNVSLSDADIYHCLVENISSQYYEEVVIELIVIGTGSVPVLGVSLEDNSIGITFISSDWFPSPEMHWEVDGGPVVSDGQEIIRNQSNGLFQLESRILLNSPSDGHVYGAVRHPVTGKEVGLYMKISADLRRTIDDLSSEVAWRKAVMTPEHITLSPETAHPELSVAPNFLTLMNRRPVDPFPSSNSRFETERCCLGLPAFSTGCHYWEVELGNCLEWAVGVASPQVRRRGDAYMFRPQENIWCISRFVEDFRALDTQEAPLAVGQLERVGVYLNLSGPRQLTFYDPKTWDALYTFDGVGHSRERVLPFFWLGTTGDTVRLMGGDQQEIQNGIMGN
ncbi:butyrophilin subfamily 1 member A1-like isoform X2 [Hyla sarda]|uniref:butyrophilin subfamily 1 member A1-like isoform X2 n=1 Tax=Hyla sarda TaxID=327740 RepID=UPI0024C2EDE9|nr:butyrophilin subfamily 1 member A1-like isoform X2 [Hyla sarda]